jgi:hypothetical protein
MKLSGLLELHLGVCPISMNMKFIAWISFGIFGYLFGLIQKGYPLKISKLYQDISMTYPTHLSMRGIHGYLSKQYPLISINIQMKYPLKISFGYPKHLSFKYPDISR